MKELRKSFFKKFLRKRKIRWTERIIDMKLGISENYKDQRGFIAEEMALKAGKYWQKKKVIRDILPAGRFTPDDLAKIDFVLKHLNGEILKINVKTYWTEDEEKKCREKGVSILPVGPEEDERTIKKRMLALIISDLTSGLETYQIRKIILEIIKERQGKEKRKKGFFSKLKWW